VVSRPALPGSFGDLLHQAIGFFVAQRQVLRVETRPARLFLGQWQASGMADDLSRARMADSWGCTGAGSPTRPWPEVRPARTWISPVRTRPSRFARHAHGRSPCAGHPGGAGGRRRAARHSPSPARVPRGATRLAGWHGRLPDGCLERPGRVPQVGQHYALPKGRPWAVAGSRPWPRRFKR
jgi:hypothetical protein